MKPGREYTCKRTLLAGRVCHVVVEQKSHPELVEVLREHERDQDSVKTRNALLNDVFIFVEGVGGVRRAPDDVENCGRRFQSHSSDQVQWPSGRVKRRRLHIYVYRCISMYIDVYRCIPMHTVVHTGLRTVRLQRRENQCRNHLFLNYPAILTLRVIPSSLSRCRPIRNWYQI